MSQQLLTAATTMASPESSDLGTRLNQLFLRLLAHEHSLDWRIWKDHQDKIEAACQAIDECELRGEPFQECKEAEVRELEISDGKHWQKFHARVPKGEPMLGEQAILDDIRDRKLSVSVKLRRAGKDWERIF